MRQVSDIRMIFVDLDGTLLAGVDTVTPRVIKAFGQIRKRGILPVIATGRPACETDFACRAIGADRYLIVMNGLAVYEDYRTGKLLHEEYMPEQTSFHVMEYLKKRPVFFEAYVGNRGCCQADHVEYIHASGMDGEHRRFYLETMYVAEDLRAYLEKNRLRIHKFFVSVGDRQEIIRLRAEIDALPGVKTLSSGENYVEIVPKHTDKQRAMRAVREACGLNPNQVMAIGDSENDLGMFEEAGLCVAMENACPELKAKARYIAPSNKEDGTAWALENLL